MKCHERMKFISAQDKKKGIHSPQWISAQSKDWWCDCPGCPSYEGTSETAYNFCALGKSLKITKEKGCICERCPVAVQKGSKHEYCCIRGTRTQTMFDDLMKKLK